MNVVLKHKPNVDDKLESNHAYKRISHRERCLVANDEVSEAEHVKRNEQDHVLVKEIQIVLSLRGVGSHGA